MTHPSLEARHVSRAFGDLKAVDDVSLAVEAGKVVVLLGKSGSGKSTLLRILAGLEDIDSGEVYAQGKLVARRRQMTPPEHRGFGMVFQDYALFPHLSAVGNVAFGLEKYGKDKARILARTWLEKVGLGDRTDDFPHQLSGGEQQRVALARALAPDPTAVLMDEPFSGLDPHLRADLQTTMLTALREAGVAALVVSHDAEEALGIADHVAIMDRGRLIQAGTPSDIYEAPRSLEAARALGPVWSIAGHADNGKVATPFGTFPTHLVGDVIVAARPEMTGITPAIDNTYRISDARGVGRFLTLTLQGGHRTMIQARIDASHAPEIGTNVGVDIAAKNVFIFPA